MLAGHDVFLFCQKDSPLSRWTEHAEFPVHRDFNLHHLWPHYIVRGLHAYCRVLEEFQPDILNPHCPPGHSFFAVAKKMTGLRIPLVRTVADPRAPHKNAFNRILHERLTQGLIFTTESSANRYRQTVDFKHIRTKVIYPGFRADDFTKSIPCENFRTRFGIGADKMLAGIIARMSPEKGQEVLLRALASLNERERARLFCVMAGEDSRERGAADLLHLAQQLGVDEYVRFLPRLDDVRALMSELDVGIVTSTRSEAICRVALEYMSFGIPVIASDVNILPEVVLHGQNGWVFPNEDPAALAACLREALNNDIERKQRGQKGAALARSKFSLAQETAETLEFFNTLQTSA